MALTRFNYQPGQYETCIDETLVPASPVLNTWYNFEIGDWKHAISDVVLKQGGSAIPDAAFELATDTKYTAREATESGKTIYAKWRIVNATYDEIATTVSGNNFGSYIDNEKLDARLDALEALEAEDIPYDNAASGLTADDVQAAIDEIITDYGTLTVATGAKSGGVQNVDVAIPFSKVLDVQLVGVTAAGNYQLPGVEAEGITFYIITDNSGNLRVSISWSEISGFTFTAYKLIIRSTL